MKRLNWKIAWGAVLVLLSTLFYCIHYALFRDSHHIFIFLLGDVAFVFFEVLMVTLIIHQVLDQREKRARLQKLNIVIGAFFSEIGTTLIGTLTDLDAGQTGPRTELKVTGAWTDEHFQDVHQWIKQYQYAVNLDQVNWDDLKHLLCLKRQFMLRILENPTVLEHESFTELLRAVFHLVEELAARTTFQDLPDPDYRHLAGDVKRVYTILADEWIDYMHYLRANYPYLFSLALRTNPFDRAASPVVQG